MYKIKSKNKVISEILSEHPLAKNAIIDAIMEDISMQIKENNLVKARLVNTKYEKPYIEIEVGINILTPEEHGKAIKIIKEIRNALPKKHKLLAYELFEILTQEPDSNE